MASREEIDPATVSDEQRYLMQRFARLVGRCLSAIEVALPEGKQCDALKRTVEKAIYEARNDLLERKR